MKPNAVQTTAVLEKRAANSQVSLKHMTLRTPKDSLNNAQNEFIPLDFDGLGLHIEPFQLPHSSGFPKKLMTTMRGVSYL